MICGSSKSKTIFLSLVSERLGFNALLERPNLYLSVRRVSFYVYGVLAQITIRQATVELNCPGDLCLMGFYNNEFLAVSLLMAQSTTISSRYTQKTLKLFSKFLVIYTLCGGPYKFRSYKRLMVHFVSNTYLFIQDFTLRYI